MISTDGGGGRTVSGVSLLKQLLILPWERFWGLTLYRTDIYLFTLLCEVRPWVSLSKFFYNLEVSGWFSFSFKYLLKCTVTIYSVHYILGRVLCRFLWYTIDKQTPVRRVEGTWKYRCRYSNTFNRKFNHTRALLQCLQFRGPYRLRMISIIKYSRAKGFD